MENRNGIENYLDRIRYKCVSLCNPTSVVVWTPIICCPCPPAIIQVSCLLFIACCSMPIHHSLLSSMKYLKTNLKRLVV